MTTTNRIICNFFAHELEAIAIFTTRDEMRSNIHGVKIEMKKGERVILIATDGRTMGILKSECGDVASETGEFVFDNEPLQVLLAVAKQVKARHIERRLPLIITMACDLNSDKVGCVFTFAATGDSFAMAHCGFKEACFPKWRTTLAALISPQRLSNPPRFALNKQFLNKFVKAAPLLNAKSDGMEFLIREGANGALLVRLPQVENFLGLLMPLLPNSNLTEETFFPQWVQDEVKGTK